MQAANEPRIAVYFERFRSPMWRPIACQNADAAAVDTASARHAKHRPRNSRPCGGQWPFPHVTAIHVRRAGECPERQRGRTVNPLAYAFVGSNPTSPTTLKNQHNLKFVGPKGGPILCCMCCKPVPRIVKHLHEVSAAHRDTAATWAAITLRFSAAKLD